MPPFCVDTVAHTGKVDQCFAVYWSSSIYNNVISISLEMVENASKMWLSTMVCMIVVIVDIPFRSCEMLQLVLL